MDRNYGYSGEFGPLHYSGGAKDRTELCRIHAPCKDADMMCET